MIVSANVLFVLLWLLRAGLFLGWCVGVVGVWVLLFGSCFSVCVFMESLILAQDERWRRA